jgi:hypothetical protein
MHLEKANDGKHKYKAVFDDGKTTKFGAVGYTDYTLSRNKSKRDAYRSRHEKDLSTGDPRRAGFLSYYILWNKETVADSLADYKRRFKL